MKIFNPKLTICCLLIATNSFAIDCQHISKKWEKMICADPKLLELENVLTYAMRYIKSSFDSEDLADWYEKIETSDYDKTISRYQDMIDKANYLNGQAQLVYYTQKPESSDVQHTIKYQLAALKINGKTIIEYPVLQAKDNNQIIEHINKVIKDTAHSYLDIISYSTWADLPYDVSTWVFVANAGLFGVSIPTGEGNPSTGYAGLSYSQKYLWDIQTGNEFMDVIEYKTYSIKQNKENIFWKVVQNFSANKWVTISDNCNYYDKDKKAFKFYVEKFSLQASDVAESGADYHQHCGNTYTVPYDQVKDFITFNETFISYLPKLIDSGVIDKKFGNQILSNVRGHAI